jgi:branched-chain amino acid transport system permease protein
MAQDVLKAPSLLPLLREGRPDASGVLRRRIGMVGVGVLVLALPYVPVLRADWLSLGVIYVIVGISLNILIGYAGQVSLGHAAFVGVGGFASAYVLSRIGLPFWFAIPFAGAMGAVVAVILGLVALRLKGLYLALITLAFGGFVEATLFHINSITGGGAGAEAPRPPGFTSERAYVYLCLFFLGLVLLVDWRLMKSKAGRAILAIRENEIAAASFGINVVMYKLLAFVVSGVFAGIGGALLASWARNLTPGIFDFKLSLTFVLMTVVGGLGSRAGIFIGSMTFAILPLALNFLTLWVPVIGPVLLLLTLTMFPGGLGQQLRPITEWLAGKPFSFKHDEGGVQTGGAGVRP